MIFHFLLPVCAVVPVVFLSVHTVETISIEIQGNWFTNFESGFTAAGAAERRAYAEELCAPSALSALSAVREALIASYLDL